MPTNLVVLAIGHSGGLERMWQRGDPIKELPDDYNWSLGRHTLPNRIRARVSDANYGDLAQYCREWEFDVQFDVVAHDSSLDGYRVKASVPPMFYRASDGANGLTRTQVESYLSKWNATIHSIAANEVVFDALIYDAAISEGFWGDNPALAQVAFSEVYTEATGVHRITADYSQTNLGMLTVRKLILNRGGNIVTESTGETVFDIERGDVFSWFKKDVRSKAANVYGGMFRRRLWGFKESALQWAEGQGGDVTVTMAQLLNNLENRATL